MARLSKDMTIERDGVEIEINVEYDATPIISATWFDPAEGGEIEIVAVFHGATAIDPPLTDEEEVKVHDYLAENLDDGEFYNPADDY